MDIMLGKENSNLQQTKENPSPLLGSDDLIDYLFISSSYGSYCGPKKLRGDLSSFLPQLCGTSKLNEQVDPAWNQKLVEKPPIQKKIQTLSTNWTIGIKLAPGAGAAGISPARLAPADSSLFSMETSGQQEASVGSEYQEFGKNFHDPQEEKTKRRKMMKWSLDDMDDGKR
ncbi:Mediator complex [Aphelenchoides avenae]|nr:Mediator complex [Aphelenchus avenae]